RVNQDARHPRSNRGHYLARKRPVEVQAVPPRARLEHAERQVVAARVMERDLPLREVVKTRAVPGVVPGGKLKTHRAGSCGGDVCWSDVLLGGRKLRGPAQFVTVKGQTTDSALSVSAHSTLHRQTSP